jgi:hypothetical protein
MENYGAQSYQDFYYSLLKFFGEGHLAGVTIIDQTKVRRSRKFRLEISQEHEEAKRHFQSGKRVKLVITDECLGL